MASDELDSYKHFVVNCKDTDQTDPMLLVMSFAVPV